jgi:formate-dependent nitrite reductase cytochrome c552 subunit
MRNWCTIIFIITVVFGSSGCDIDPWVLGDSATDNVTITKITRYGTAADGITPLKAKVGPVVMSHQTHEREGLACVDCHHKDKNPEREKACARCHIGDNGFEAMHGLCLDCHIGKNRGPQKCMQCH